MRNKFIVILLIILMIIIFSIFSIFYLEENVKKDEGCNCNNNSNFNYSKYENMTLSSKPLLWKISTENPSYLYGSIHLKNEDVLTLPAIVYDKLLEVDNVYTEIKLDDETINEMILYSIYIDGTTIDDLVTSGDILEKLYNYLDSIDLSSIYEMSLKSFKPWYLANSITILEHELKYYNHPSLDSYIWKLAEENNKETYGLETINEHLDVFFDMSLEDQIRYLNDSLNYIIKNNVTEDINQLLDAYLEGDLEEIDKLINTEYEENDPFYDDLLSQLINDRNVNMINDIINLVENNPDEQYFFTIGAGHFYGDDGILNLIRGEGYNVTLVQFNESNTCKRKNSEIHIKNKCYIEYDDKYNITN